MAALTQQFQATDTMAYNTLNTAGLWSISAQPGALNGLGGMGLIWGRTHAIRRGILFNEGSGLPGMHGLGAIQLLIAGVLAVTALGVIAYVVTIMTKCARDAAAQTKATAESILATVDTLKASCQKSYLDSTKDAAAEAALQTCLMQTKALTDSIPKPPDAGDPLGLKYVALLGAVGVAGLIAVAFIKSRSK